MIVKAYAAALGNLGFEECVGQYTTRATAYQINLADKKVDVLAAWDRARPKGLDCLVAFQKVTVHLGKKRRSSIFFVVVGEKDDATKVSIRVTNKVLRNWIEVPLPQEGGDMYLGEYRKLENEKYLIADLAQENNK